MPRDAALNPKANIGNFSKSGFAKVQVKGFSTGLFDKSKGGRELFVKSGQVNADKIG